MHSRQAIILCSLILLLILAQGRFSPVDSSTTRDLNQIRVAVYDGGVGVSSEPRESSAAALYWMFQWMNATVEMVNSSSIRQGILEDFQIVAIPGGYAYDYYLDLGPSGENAIREFIAVGGAYWGVCAGAYFALEEFDWSEDGHTGTYYYGLGLFPGRGVGPIVGIADWPDYVMTDVQLNKSNGIIDFTNEPDTHSIMYYGGPYFETEGMNGITTIATYSFNGKPAMIAFEYEQGRVFLTGPHSEWEEDSFRDGCVWDNHLEDDGSEWQLCKDVSTWLASVNAPTTPVSIDPLVIASVGVATLVILSFIWFKRK